MVPIPRLAGASVLLAALVACDVGPSVEEQFSSATELVARDDLPAAIIKLKTVLQAQPEHREARRTLGEVYLKMGFAAAASKELERARELGANSLEVEAGLLRSWLVQGELERVAAHLEQRDDVDQFAVLQEIRGELALARREFDTARAQFESALALDDKSVMARVGLGQIALIHGESEQALEHANDASEIDPSQLEPWLLRGRLALRERDFEQARRMFERAVEVAGFNPNARIGLVHALLSLERPEEAEKHLDLTANWAARTTELTYLRAVAARQKGDDGEALALLNELLTGDPNHVRALYLAALLHHSRAEHEQAVARLRSHLANATDKAAGARLLAVVQLEQGNVDEAIRVLEEATRDDPTSAALLTLLGSTYMRQGDFVRATSALEQASRHDPNDAPMRTRLAASYFGAGEFQKAVGMLESAREIDGTYVDADVLLALTHLRQNQPDAAFQAASALHERAPSNPVARYLMGLAQLEAEQPAKAREHFEAALEIDSAYRPALIALTRLEAGTGENAAAIARYERIVEQDERDVDALVALAALEHGRGNTERAVELAERARKLDRGGVRPRLMLFEHHLAQQNVQAALELAEEINALAPANVAAATFLARVHRERGDARRAVEILEAAVGTSPSEVTRVEPLLELAQAHLVLKDYERADRYLRRAIELAPDSARARSLLALKELVTGDPAQTLAELERAGAESESRPDSLRVLARLELGEFDDALDEALAIARDNPQQPVGHNLAGYAYLGKGLTEQARERFEQALAVAPQDRIALLNLARLDVTHGRVESARTRYRQVLDTRPGHLEAALSLARIEERVGNENAMLSLLHDARTANPEAPEPLVALGRFHASKGNAARATQLLEQARSTAPDRLQPGLLLARAQAAQRDWSSARQTLEALAARHPRSATVQKDLGEAQLALDDDEAAMSAFRRAVELAPDDSDAAYMLGSVLLRRGQLEDASRVAAGIRERDADSPAGFMLGGQAALARGAPGEAVTAFESAITRGAGSGVVLLRARALALAGDRDAALQSLRDWTRERPDDVTVRLALADIHAAQGQQDAAIAEYEAVLATDPNNVAALNNLAGIRHRRGDPRALELAARAHAQAPDLPAVIDTYGWLLVENGEIDQGVRLLEQAWQRAPDNTEIRFHLAAGLAARGDLDAARGHLEAMLSDSRPFAERSRARMLLDQIEAR